MEDRFINHESRISNLEAREEADEARLKVIEHKVDDLSAIKTCLQQLTKNDTERKENIKEIKEDLSIMKTDISNLKADHLLRKEKMNYRYGFWTAVVVAALGIIGTVLGAVL